MTVTQIIIGTSVSSALHPITLSKHLMQIGYEPFPPYASTTLFRKPVLLYPNILKYMGHVIELDGYSGLYRGIGPRIVSGVTGNLVTTAVLKKLKARFARKNAITADTDDKTAELDETWEDCAIEILCEVTARSAGIVISHPFHVLMLRSMAQFVGREHLYDNSFSGLYEIYKTDGILGFFGGLVPRLLADILSLSVVYAVSHAVTYYAAPKPTKDVKSYTKTISSLLVGQMVYPLHVVGTLSAVNTPSLQAGRPPLMPYYSGWLDCFNQLSKMNQLKRGGAMFFRRYYPAPLQVRTNYRTGTLRDFA